MSWSTENRLLSAFGNAVLQVNAQENDNSPNWDRYRLSLERMRSVVSKTKHSKTKTEARSTQNSKTKHPNLENEAPKSRKRSTLDRKRSTQNSKTKHPKLENEDPKISKTKHSNLENEVPKTRNHCRLYVLHDAIRIRWRQRMHPHLQRSTKSIPRFYKSLPTV